MSDNKRSITTVFPREAAALELEKLVASKGKGDHITAREVLDATGFEASTWSRRIKTLEKRYNLVIKAVNGDGYRILTDAEHADAARRTAESAARKERESLRRLTVTDRAKLDDAQVRRHEWMFPRVAARAARAEQDVKDTRKEFKLTERVPLRLLADKS